MVIKFNSSKAGSSDFAPLPEGTYEVIIDRGEKKQSAAGNDMINFQLKVRNDVEGQSYGGRVLFYTLTFTEATEGIVQGFLQAIGTPEGKEFNSYEEVRDYALGKAVESKVVKSVWQGKEGNNVKYLNKSKVGGGRIEDPFAPSAPSSYAPDPFAAGQGHIEISEDDLPF